MSKEYIDDETIKRIEKIAQQEAIDNANPSEALEGLKHIKKYYVPQPCSAKTYDYLEIIEHSLLKAQEQEKVFEIIFEKSVDIDCIKQSNNVDEYNSNSESFIALAQEEFDLLKRYFGNENI